MCIRDSSTVDVDISDPNKPVVTKADTQKKGCLLYTSEPNAYLAALYWDSEMFGRSSRKRKEAEKGQEQKDYRQELIYLFNHMDVFFDTPHKRHVAERYRNFFMSVSAIATDADYKHIYCLLYTSRCV